MRFFRLILLGVKLLAFIAIAYALIYPFMRPVTVYKDISLKTNGQPYFTAEEITFKTDLELISKGYIGEVTITGIVLLSKLKINKIVSPVAIYWKGIALDGLRADILGGLAVGFCAVDIGKNFSYRADIDITGAGLEEIVEAFELAEKIALTGTISGGIELRGRGAEIDTLYGDLSASPEGGVLVIKSREWLEQIASYAKQDVNVVMDNFKNYSYNEGSARLGIKGKGVIIDAHLNGASGRRDLFVELHDLWGRAE